MISSVPIPTEEERKRVREVIEELKEKLSNVGEAIPAGSTAKDTFLSGDTDIDLFIVSENREETLRKVAELFPEGKEKKGTIKLWNFKYKGFDVDVGIINKEYTNRWFTLEHTDFYLEKLNEEQRNEVRRLKALFKSYACYGAENGGITGVAIEELIRRYKDSRKACEEIIGRAPFWLQDPTAERHNVKRNLMASIKPEKLELIKKACKEYLEGKEIKYERADAHKFAELRMKEGWEVMIMPKITGQKDKDFQKAYSTCRKACRELRGKEGDIDECRCDAFANGKNVAVAFRVMPQKLGEVKTICLPSGLAEEDYERFKEVHKDWYINEEGRICADVRREIRDTVEFMKERITREILLLYD